MTRYSHEAGFARTKYYHSTEVCRNGVLLFEFFSQNLINLTRVSFASR